MARPPSQFNIVSISIYLLLFTGCYLTYKYVPVVWKMSQLENILQDVSYGANRLDAEATRKILIERADREEGVTLQKEDIFVDKNADRVRIRMVWRPILEFLGRYVKQHEIVISKETVFYN